MAIDPDIIKKISDAVKLKPRTVQEISEIIKKNWRTAERYVDKISEETGDISTRVFRKGTRGALKIVYWSSIESIHSTSFQEGIFRKIMSRMRKAEFSPFDIYQFVPDRYKKAFVEDLSKLNTEKEVSQEQDLVGSLRQASKQVYIFAGNLSFINLKQNGIRILDVLRELVKRNISIKVVSRVSLIGVENVKILLALNKAAGKELVEIRHRYQPLRGIMVDKKLIKMSETRYPEYYRKGELKKKIGVFYDIYDPEWLEWMQKVFWRMFSIGIPAERRIREIEKIKKQILIS